MNAGDLYKAGRLREAIDAQVQEVKSNPGDQARRLFLFELLAFAGRATGRIARSRRSPTTTRTRTWRSSTTGSSWTPRRRVDDSSPRAWPLTSSASPPNTSGSGSRRSTGSGNIGAEEASETLSRAAEATPTIRGRLNDVPFESLRDADDLLSGVLEVMLKGRYYWVGLDQVTSLTMEPPRFARDLLFIPARLSLQDVAGDVFLPALYPNSFAHPDDQVKLGRMTDWHSIEGGPTLGLGLHTYLRDDEDITLLQWRELSRGDESAPSASDPAIP